MEISYLVKKSLEFYDKKNNEYKKLINNKDFILDKVKSTIKFKNFKETYEYQLLGIFDNQTNIWMWAWMIPSIELLKSELSRDLLNYGLKLDITGNDYDMIYLKTQLLNSRFLLEDYLQLELHLAIASYLIRDNFQFIYPVRDYLNKEKNTYITKYLLISKKK